MKVHNQYIGPAYGRTYKNEKEVLRDWEAGKDFSSEGGYINREDALKFGKGINFYYRFPNGRLLLVESPT